jgi:peptidoglycan lytic transglycosylase G
LARGGERGQAKPGRRGKGKKKGCRRPALLGCVVLLLLLLVPVAMTGWAWWRLAQPYQGYAGTERLVAIDPGMGASQALERLQREGVLADAKLARSYLVFRLHNRPLQAGEYRFSGPLTTAQVLDKLIRGDVVTAVITLVEGLTLEETAEQLARERFGRREVFLDLMRTPALIADLDPQATDLEGYLFPETYKFVLNTSEREIVATLVKTFRRRFEREVRPLLARHPGASVRRLVTLASIVEKEAKVESERALIAAVYANRLDRHIGLAADPTVIYALKRLGRWNGNLRREDLQLDSPYNTYRYAGLPPGPICSPGRASLVAAADPAQVPYLYFVSRNDSTHVFAETLQEHNRNVEIWQRQYWRDRRAAERR